MAFKWLEAWLGSSGEPQDPAQALVRAAYDGARVQVQIENSLIRFDSHLSVKSNGQVMVGKPAGLNGHLTAGSVVRVRLPGREKHDARLAVSISHLNLPNGKVAFVCRAPDELIQCRRRAERFNALRYNNLRLQMAGDRYRLADLSSAGLKVLLAGTQGSFLFPLGHELHSCSLVLGPEVHVRLETVVPRNYQHGMVGCEYTINPDSKSARTHGALLDTISKSESTRIAAT